MNFQIVFITLIFALHATIVQAKLINRDNENQLNNFKSCIANQIYPINLTGVYFEPNPIIVGMNQNTRLVGSLSTTVQQGSFASLLLSNNGNIIADYQIDVCSSLGQNCPINPSNFDIVISSVPSIVSVNSTITLNTTISGESFLFNYALNLQLI